MIALVLMIFGFSSYNKDWMKYKTGKTHSFSLTSQNQRVGRSFSDNQFKGEY